MTASPDGSVGGEKGLAQYSTKRKRERLQRQIESCEQAVKQLQTQSHPDFILQIQSLQEAKDRYIEAVYVDYHLLEESTQDIYNYECQEAEMEYDSQREKLKASLLEDIEREIKQMKALRDGGVEKTKKSRTTTRKTRSSKAPVVEPVKTPVRPSSATTKPRKRNGAVFQPLRKVLTRSEISSDLKALSVNWKACEKMRNLSKEPIHDVRTYRDRLFYNNMIIEDGDEVNVEYQHQRSNSSGIVCAFTSTEIFLLTDGGTYIRVNLMDLRRGLARLSLVSNSSDEESY